MFRAYSRLSEYASSRKDTLKSEIQCSGVSLIGYAPEDGKDLASKMIMGEV